MDLFVCSDYISVQAAFSLSDFGRFMQMFLMFHSDMLVEVMESTMVYTP